MRLYLSSLQLGDHPDIFASMVGASTDGFVIMNAVDGGDSQRRDQAASQQIEGLARLGLRAELLDLRDLRRESLDRDLAGAGFFWVHGGNAFTLRMAMSACGFDAYVVEGLHADRFVYAGFSAGGCVLAPTLDGLELCDSLPDCELIYGQAMREGLAVLDRPFVPHLESADPREAEIMATVAAYYEGRGQPYWALRDGQALVVNRGAPQVR